MSGGRYTVEYTGGGGAADEDGGSRPEPAFIRQFKQRTGILSEPKLADKFDTGGDSKGGSKGLGKARSNDAEDEGREPAARSEEEMPQIVVSADSGISEAELAVVQSRIREAGEEAKFEEARSRVRFVRPTVAGGGDGSRKTKLAVISASSGGSGGGAEQTADDGASLAKRSRPQAGVGSSTTTSSSSAGKNVCNRKLLSFDEEEGDD